MLLRCPPSLVVPPPRYQEAAAAYEVAGDLDSVVLLSLERLNTPQRAYAIVRKTRSVEGATALYKYCLQSQDFKVGGGGWGRGQVGTNTSATNRVYDWAT